MRILYSFLHIPVAAISRLTALLAVILLLGGTSSWANGLPEMRLRTLEVGSAALSVPLTSQQGVVIADVPVSLHGENHQLFITRWEEDRPVKRLLADAARVGTLTSRDQHLLAVFVRPAPQRRLVARESTDGGRTWGAEIDLGAAPAGPPLPTACLWQQDGVLRRAVAWSEQPGLSEGPLVIRVHDGNRWLAPVRDAQAASSGAALACADDEPPEIVWRDHRYGLGPRAAIYHARLDPASGAIRSVRLALQPGFDPSFCRQGARRFIGYHGAINDTHLARSDDGGQTFFDAADLDAAAPRAQLDDSGKFVAVACAGDLVAAAWGDWPTKDEAARAPRSDHSRRLALAVSPDGGRQWRLMRPAGMETAQSTPTVAVRDGQIALLWRAPGQLRLALWHWTVK